MVNHRNQNYIVKVMHLDGGNFFWQAFNTNTVDAEVNLGSREDFVDFFTSFGHLLLEEAKFCGSDAGQLVGHLLLVTCRLFLNLSLALKNNATM